MLNVCSKGRRKCYDCFAIEVRLKNRTLWGYRSTYPYSQRKGASPAPGICPTWESTKHGPLVHGPLVHGPLVHGPLVHGPLVHGPPPWTGSMDRVHQNMDRIHGPLSWTGSMDPLFLLPLKLLIRSKQK